MKIPKEMIQRVGAGLKAIEEKTPSCILMTIGEDDDSFDDETICGISVYYIKIPGLKSFEEILCPFGPMYEGEGKEMNFENLRKFKKGYEEWIK